MTDGEKKMKKYTTSVERRLALPGDMKARVMCEFIGSVASRRASGMTDEEIYTELGSPEKVAADLNERMKAYTFCKSPWRYLFAVLAVFGAYDFVGGVVALLLRIYQVSVGAGSIGIIGGADGPTMVFVTTPGWFHTLLPAGMLIIGIWGFLMLSRCKRK